PQARLHLVDEALPALQSVFLMFAGHPALDDIPEQSLKFRTMIGSIAEYLQGLGFNRQQVVHVSADNFVSEELVEGGISLHWQLFTWLARPHPLHGRASRVPLSTQLSSYTAVEA